MFFWDSWDKSVELQTFQEKCHILFEGHTKMKMRIVMHYWYKIGSVNKAQ